MTERLMDLLPYGREHAVSGRTLCAALELHDGRELRRIVHQARIEGDVVAACRDGYFKPRDLLELRGYTMTWRLFAQSFDATLQAAEQRIRELERQTEQEGGGDGTEKEVSAQSL